MSKSTERIISIDVLPAYNVAESQQLHDVVVVHADGFIECFSGGLAISLWQLKLEDLIKHPDTVSHETRKMKIEHVEAFDQKSTIKGLFKNRDDILALLASHNKVGRLQSQSARILCLIEDVGDSSHSTHNLHIMAIQPRMSTHAAMPNIPMQLLLSTGLPSPESTHSTPDTKSSWSIDPKSGLLQQLHNGVVHVFDLAPTIPKHLSRFNQPGHTLESIVSLSPSLVFATSASHFGVYDTKYGSVQAIRTSALCNDAKSTGAKRKHSNDGGLSENPFLLAFFSRLGLVIAVSGSAISGLQISDNLRLAKRQKHTPTSLLNSMFRGVADPQLAHADTDSTNFPSVLKRQHIGNSTSGDASWWEVQETQLDEAFEAKDVQLFDDLFAQVIQTVGTTGSHAHSNGEDRANGDHANGHDALGKNGVEGLKSWSQPKASTEFNHPMLFRRPALYALRKIFSLEPRTETTKSRERLTGSLSSISIVFFPPNAFQWLFDTEQLAPAVLLQALSQAATPTESLGLSPGDLVDAIVNYDRSLNLLDAVLSSPLHLPIDELSKAVQLIIESFGNSALPRPDPKLIADASMGDSNQNDQDIDVFSETEAAMGELHYASSLLESGLDVRRRSLQSALTSLNNRFPSSRIAQSLRRILSHHELVFLIHLLRIELANGGWTARYIDNTHLVTEADEPNDRAIMIITKLLGCAVNAIGVSGWLVASASDPVDALDDLLGHLRAEVSAALEGMHEATFINSFLSEFLGYSWRKEIANTGVSDGPKNQIVTMQMGDAREDGKVLPFGLKVEQPISRTETSAGGEVRQKSRRQMGMERSMRVPTYSYESIRI